MSAFSLRGTKPACDINTAASPTNKADPGGAASIRNCFSLRISDFAGEPATFADNFLRDFGERFVPGYKTVSTVDILMNAPFDE